MANKFKYNKTGTEIDSLFKGNWAIDTSAPNSGGGPSSTTGLYHGAPIPNGGYAIYSPGSVYTAATDEDLIGKVRDLGGDWSSVSAALIWASTEPTVIILNKALDNIVTDGLVLNLDASQISSYPTIGTTWFDISGNNANFPLVDVGFNNGELEFNGINSGAQKSISGFNPDITASTIIVTFKANDLSAGEQAIFSDNYGPEYGIWLHTNGNLKIVAYTAVYATITAARFYHAVLTVVPGANRSSTDQTYIQGFLNGELIGESNSNTGNGMNDQPFTLGYDWKSGAPARYFNGSIASAQIYKKKLNESEILQNYYGGPILTDGLIRALDFSNLVCYESGNTSGYDLTGNDTFDLFNSPPTITSFGGGISFSETNEFLALNDVTATDYVTVECWYTRNAGSSGEDIVFNKESCWELNDNGGTISWALMASNRGWFWQATGATIGVGETAHIALSYDGNQVKFHKNGALVQTYTYPSGGVLANQIAAYPKLNSRNATRTSTQNLGNHDFYQFRIYDRALTDTEVTQNFNAQRNRFGI